MFRLKKMFCLGGNTGLHSPRWAFLPAFGRFSEACPWSWGKEYHVLRTDGSESIKLRLFYSQATDSQEKSCPSRLNDYLCGSFVQVAPILFPEDRKSYYLATNRKFFWHCRQSKAKLNLLAQDFCRWVQWRRRISREEHENCLCWDFVLIYGQHIILRIWGEMLWKKGAHN